MCHLCMCVTPLHDVSPHISRHVSPRRYIATCSRHDWHLPMTCQAIWCAAPNVTSEIKSTVPLNPIKFGQTLTVLCADRFSPDCRSHCRTRCPWLWAPNTMLLIPCSAYLARTRVCACVRMCARVFCLSLPFEPSSFLSLSLSSTHTHQPKWPHITLTYTYIQSCIRTRRHIAGAIGTTRLIYPLAGKFLKSHLAAKIPV